MSKGKLFAIEGIDGSGKDTLADLLKRWFELHNRKEFAFTAEPSEGEIGRTIQRILEGEEKFEGDPWELQVMFTRDRLNHIHTFIVPEIEAGQHVISVRYVFSTFAYGMLTKPLEYFLEINRQIIGEEMVWPTLTLLLDVEVEEGLRRIREAGRQFSYFEEKERLEKVRANYLELAKRNDMGDFYVINADKNKRDVRTDALIAIFGYTQQ